MPITLKMPRTPNFTLNEKATFVDLILRYPILTSARTQVGDKRDINKRKDVAWCKLAEEFNAIGLEVYRDVEKLKRLWKNIKADAKTVHAKIAREQRKTGGGTPDMPSSEPGMMAIYDKIISSIPNQINSLDSQYDDDAPPFSSESSQNESFSHSSEIGETSTTTSRNASYSQPNEVGETSTAADRASSEEYSFTLYQIPNSQQTQYNAPNVSSDISPAYAILSEDTIISSQSQITPSLSQISSSSGASRVLERPQRGKENQPRSKEGIRKRKIDAEELKVEVLQAKIKQLNAQTRLAEVQLKATEEKHSAEMSLLKKKSLSLDAQNLDDSLL